MSVATPEDLDTFRRHRAVWAARPELREVYREFFRELLLAVRGKGPVLEVGSGPGFLKEYAGRVLATDVVMAPWIDLRCDATRLPFASGSLGGIVAVDVIHHLPRPLSFLAEAGRVLRPGGRLAAIEPWISPCSWLLYRCIHHEDCRLSVDLSLPFPDPAKGAMEGNSALPYLLLRAHPRTFGRLRVVQAEPFLGLPYLSTMGFQRERPLPGFLLAAARALEGMLGAARAVAASRAVLVWEREGDA